MGSRNAEINRKLRAAAALRGDCISCKCRPAKEGRRTCQHCLDVGRDLRKRLEAKRVAAGKCRCGARPRRGMATCARCADRANARQQRQADYWIARGRCGRCGAGPLSSVTLCAGCSAAMVDAARGRRAAKVAAGMCSRDGCGAQLHSASMCFGHVLEMRRAGRARSAARAA